MFLKLGPYVAEFCRWGRGGLFCTLTNEINVAELKTCLQRPVVSQCLCLQIRPGPRAGQWAGATLYVDFSFFLWQHNESLSQVVATEKNASLQCCHSLTSPSFLHLKMGRRSGIFTAFCSDWEIAKRTRPSRYRSKSLRNVSGTLLNQWLDKRFLLQCGSKSGLLSNA